MQTPQFTIITVTLNSEAHLQECMESVSRQKDVLVQHIIKDGLSTDNTLDITSVFDNVQVVSASDRGIYDAMNQGCEFALGDFIAFLNSDDYYADPGLLRKVLATFKNEDADIVCTGITKLNPVNNTHKYWRVGTRFKRFGIRQYPHPGVFIKKSLLKQLDLPFDPSMNISSDYKQQLLLFSRPNVKVCLLDDVSVCMRLGGASTNSIKSKLLGIFECAISQYQVNGLFFVPLSILKMIRA